MNHHGWKCTTKPDGESTILRSSCNKITRTVSKKKKNIFVELWLVFAPRQCIGAQSNFGPPVFSWETNTSARTRPLLIRSCSVWLVYFPKTEIFAQRNLSASQLKTRTRKQQNYLNLSHNRGCFEAWKTCLERWQFRWVFFSNGMTFRYSFVNKIFF